MPVPKFEQRGMFLGRRFLELDRLMLNYPLSLINVFANLDTSIIDGNGRNLFANLPK